MRLAFDNTYAALPQHFYATVGASPVAAPRIIRVNRPLAEQLGVDPDWLASQEGAEIVAGNRFPEGATPIATAYAGHQFGSLNPQLGDGRALLLGEIVTPRGERFDLQLKGSGRTPFSRSGDGRSPLGPVLREYMVSEAMAALGVPSTRALAAASSGEPVLRDRALPGGVLLRVARSHIRVGTFEFFGCRDDAASLHALVAHTLARHYPHVLPTLTTGEGARPALELLRGVAQRQAELVARWQLIGFIHGVMNTDNMLVSGETIDFGPCAFMDAFDPATVFSSIDRRGRYAYANQPAIAQWNVACLARALLPVIGPDDAASVAEAQAIIDAFPEQHVQACREGWKRKLGLSSHEDGDGQLVEDLLRLMHETQMDFTLTFRHLFDVVSAQSTAPTVAPLLARVDALAPWLARWTERLARDPMDVRTRAESMRLANPVVIPRNHQVEAAIRDAEDNADFARFNRLVDTLADPYTYSPDKTWLARPPESHERVLQTFCGT